MKAPYYTARTVSADAVRFAVENARGYPIEFATLNAAKKAATKCYRYAESCGSSIALAEVLYWENGESRLAAQKFGADGEWIDAVLD